MQGTGKRVSAAGQIGAKWADLNSLALGDVFPSRDRLAEFWRDVSAGLADDPSDVRAAWPFVADVAQSLFVHQGRAHPDWEEKHAQRVAVEVANLLDAWGEIPSAVLSGKLLDKAGRVSAVVQYRSAQEAAQRLIADGQDARLVAGPLAAATPGLHFSYQANAAVGVDALRAQLTAFLAASEEECAMGNAVNTGAPARFGYYIDLDERGDFQADVRDAQGHTVFEIRAGASLGEDESSIFEDGFMRDKHDLSGLAQYLQSLGILADGDQVLEMVEFERYLEDLDEQPDASSQASAPVA